MSLTDSGEARHPARIQVSQSKQPLNFYVNLSKRLMHEHGEVQLSALGLAVSTMVTVAEILKKEGWALEKKLTTYLDAFTSDGRQRQIQKPKMEVILVKSPKFDELMAEHLASQAASAAANGNGNGNHLEEEHHGQGHDDEDEDDDEEDA